MSGVRVIDLANADAPALVPVRAPAAEPARQPLRLVHVGIHSNLNGNAGDTLLFRVVRDLVEHVAGPVAWERRQVWEALDADEAAALGARSDGVIVGGGGLLLRDQAGSDTARSGWQWNASIDAVRALTVPLAIFAIGYNRFRDQPDFAPPFAEHLAAVAERATLLGLRNSGSIAAVRSYLPAHLQDRPRLLHCPTTVLAQVYGLRGAPRGDQPVLGVNFALDRPERRFGGRGERQDRALSRYAAAVAAVQQRGWRVRVLRHKELDAPAERHLDAAGVTYETYDLSSTTPEGVVAGYQGLDVVAGMRGHGQLVPFGLRIPIVSVVSHDKLAWFLDDLGHPEWGVELGADDVSERLVAAIDAAATDARRAEVERLQARVWEQTLTTVRDVVSRLRAAATARAGGPARR